MKEKNNIDWMSFEEDEFNLREVFEKYLYHWRWFVIGLLLSIITAYFYLRYTAPQYEVMSTILIHDKENESIASELSAFQDLGLAANNKSLFDTEMGILKSRSLMERVVKELGINLQYYAIGRVRKTELYGEGLPYKLNFFGKDSLVYHKDTLFSIIAASQTQFKLLDAEGLPKGTYEFGANISSEIGDFTITPNTITPLDIGLEIMVQIETIATITDYYRKIIQVEANDKKSSLINMSLQDEVKKKAHDILTALVEQYNREAIIDKSMIATNTDTFINERIAAISKELAVVDMDAEIFKSSNQLTDIASEADLILNTSNELEREIVNLNTQIKLVDYVLDHMNQKANDLIPANLGLAHTSLNQSTLLYNEILLERNRILQSSNSLNPVIMNLESQIANLRTNITQSLVNLKTSLLISLTDVESQEGRLSSRITAVPKQEREFRDIQRQQQIIETLYLYLLQKREENAISLAVTAPNAKIIDAAYGSDIPVSPKSIIIYLSAGLLGLIVPFAGIYLLFLFDNKVHTIEDIEAVVKAPILGDVPMSKDADKFVISENDSDAITESFRMLRTNVHFMLSKIKDSSKTIFISSTIKGEGKTFTAINMARVLALSSKKILLIGGDIRNPKLAEYLNIPKKEGLTHYLMDVSRTPKSIIQHVPALQCDVIQSGTIAPNPSELLMNGRFEALLQYAHDNYDYVIVDTSPINMVTDTLLLSQDKADLFIYVIRANFLDKRMLRIPEKLYETKRLQNMAIVLNDTNPDGAHGYGYGYSYGYGYGYGQDIGKKVWWKRLF